MWSGYSAREAAEFVGLSESAVRACVRAGLVEVSSPEDDLPRFSFRALSVLKTVKALMREGLSPRRVRRQLALLRQRLPQDKSLAELSVTAHGGHVVVRDVQGAAVRTWRADSGQVFFDFAARVPEGEVTAMPLCREAAAPEPVACLTADEWFDRAVELEDGDAVGAIDAYQRALRLNPECTETLTNLGRLYAEGGQFELASQAFQEALEIDPTDAIALYNLGVVAQDAGHDDDAIRQYTEALKLDPSLSEAHYNLATIFDRCGDPRAAIRHIHEYRKLTR